MTTISGKRAVQMRVDWSTWRATKRRLDAVTRDLPIVPENEQLRAKLKFNVENIDASWIENRAALAGETADAEFA